MRVLALVPYPTIGASNRLRVEQYAPLLREQSIELVVSPFLDEAAYRILYREGRTTGKIRGVLAGIGRRAADVARARAFDLVLVHRESAALGPPVVEGLLRRLGVPYVFDFDDAIFLGEMHPANSRWTWLRDPSRVADAARGARAVIAGNGYLAAWARAHNADVEVIHTAVDTDRFRPRGDRPEGPTVIGWVGSSTTAPYLHLVDDPLAEMVSGRGCVVRVIGGHYANPHVPVELRPYQLDREPAEVASFDIGILPEPDNAWTRGKGALKALLYMAVGIPVVASRVGVNPDVVRHGESGYCVEGPDEWADALGTLADDAGLRARLGAAGRERAVREYSVRALAPRLAAVLRRAAS